MNLFGWLQFAFYIIVLLALVKPLGLYMARVYQGKRTFLAPILAPVERFFYRLAGVKPEDEMGWKTYAVALLLFNLVELLFLYLLLRLQHLLPLNPHQFAILREETTGKVCDIQWQPTVIGRPSTDVDHNIMLAVNVQLLPNGMTVSRRHAQITLSEGHYFIEPLAEQNPVYLNEKELDPLTKREIKPGDKLLLGRNKIVMTFLTQALQPSALKEPKLQTAPLRPIPTPVPPPVSQPVSEKKGETLFVSEENILSYLVVEKCTVSERIGQRHDIIAYPFVLGRETPILLNESEISRRHAEVTFDPRTKKFYITDLHSTNGVAINAKSIQPDIPHEISPGVIIQLGPSVIVRFEI